MAFQDPNSPAGAAVAAGGIGFAAGEAMGLANAGIQYYSQKKLNRQAQHMTQENMRLQKMLNLEQQYQSIANSTSAYKAAGLNPALATGAPAAAGVSMAPGNAGSAAMPQAPDVAALLGAGVQLDMLATQKENLKANTELQNEEAREKKIENDREQSKDSLVSSSFMSNVRAIAESTENPFIRGFCEDFLERVGESDFNLGAYEAFNETFFAMSQRERDRELDYKAKEMDKKVLSLQYDNGAAQALADMPKAQRLQIYRNVALMGAQIAQLNAETSLTDDKRAAIRASIDKLGQETMSILHHDPAAMWQSGDISSLLVSLGYEGVKAASFGAGMAAGSRLTGGTGAAGAVPKFAPERSKTIKNAEGVGMPKETFLEIVRRADAYAKGDPVKRAQMINKGVDFWQKNKSNPKYK